MARRREAVRRGRRARRHAVLGRLPRRPAPGVEPGRTGLPGAEPEVGLLPVELTEEAGADPVFAEAPDGARHPPVARGHLRPAGGRRASGRLARVPEPGVSVRERVRRPVPPRGLDRDGPRMGWRCPSMRRRSSGARPGRDTGDFVTRIEERSAEMLAHGRGLFERWLDTVVEPARARGGSSDTSTVAAASAAAATASSARRRASAPSAKAARDDRELDQEGHAVGGLDEIRDGRRDARARDRRR